MIKVLARPTNNAKQFWGRRKGGKIKCEHFTNFCAGLNEIFCFYESNLSVFVICFNVVEFILFCQNADHPQPTNNFPKQKDLSIIEQRYVRRNAINFNTTVTRLDLFIAIWINAHLVCTSHRSIAVLTGTSNNHIPSIKSGTWWRADIPP